MALKRRAIAVNLVHDPLHWRLWHHVDDINQGIWFGRPDAFRGALRESVEFRYLIVKQRIDGKPSDRPWRAGRRIMRRVISFGGHEFRNKGGGAVSIGKTDLAAVAGVVSVAVAALPVSGVPVAALPVSGVRRPARTPAPTARAGSRWRRRSGPRTRPRRRSWRHRRRTSRSRCRCRPAGRGRTRWPARSPAGTRARGTRGRCRRRRRHRPRDRGGDRSHPHPGDLRPTHRHVAVCRSYPLRSQYRARPTCCHCQPSRAQ